MEFIQARIGQSEKDGNHQEACRDPEFRREGQDQRQEEDAELDEVAVLDELARLSPGFRFGYLLRATVTIVRATPCSTARRCGTPSERNQISAAVASGSIQRSAVTRRLSWAEWGAFVGASPVIRGAYPVAGVARISTDIGCGSRPILAGILLDTRRFRFVTPLHAATP